MMTKHPAVDEHFTLITLIGEYYKNGDYNRCEKYCIEDIQLFPAYIDALTADLDFSPNDTIPLRLVSFETLVKVYEKQRRYDEAIEICEMAIKLKVHDGTKGGFAGRIEKLNKLKTNPPKPKIQLQASTQDNIQLAATQANALAENEALGLDWHISVSFNKSSSGNFTKALFLAQNASYKYYETQFDGNIIYQAVFSEEREQYLGFIQLYELVAGWKSSFTTINGKLVDRKIVGGLNYCYGDKCRSGRSDFCFGASEATENPFGCHRLQISKYNNPWWSFASQVGNKIIIDKRAIQKRIDEYCRAYTDCPSFDYDDIIKRLDSLPNELTIKQHTELQHGKLLNLEPQITIGGTGQANTSLPAQNTLLSKIKGLLGSKD